MGISLGVVTIIGGIFAVIGVGIWQGVKHKTVHGENNYNGTDGGYDNYTSSYNNYTSNSNTNITNFDPGVNGLGDITFGAPSGAMGGHGIPDWQIGVIVACAIALLAVTIAGAVVFNKRRKAKKIEDEKVVEKSMEEKRVGEDDEDDEKGVNVVQIV